MQANYPEKYPRVHWDSVNVEYPVRVKTKKDISSEEIARKWRTPPEVLHERSRAYIDDIKQYSRDYTICNELNRPQTSLDYDYKTPDVNIFYKPSPCVDNKYIYPPSRHLEHQPPACKVHGTTETKDSFKPLTNSIHILSGNDQIKNSISTETYPVSLEPTWRKELKPIDTTYDGFEKYLDPYLTTSRLNHRPFTSEQLKKVSNSKDIITYYTLSNVPWIRTIKPKHEEWFPRVTTSKPKTMTDREKFKSAFREIRAHNRLQWVPGSFRTEVSDNFGVFTSLSNLPKEQYEEEISTLYKREIAKLNANTLHEHPSMQGNYAAESSVFGSRKPICAVFQQCAKKK